MKKILLGLLAFLLFFPYLKTQADEPNLSYYQIRYEIACRDRDETDARCFWNKVEYVHAKEVLDRSDVFDYLTRDELERITKKLRFLETRHETFCEEAEETAYFCSSLNKLVEKGQYFMKNEQQYSHEGEAGVKTEAIVVDEIHESASETYECMNEVGSDIHKLDLDNDGEACETLP